MSLVVNPPDLAPPRGFAHGVLAAPGRQLLAVAGQIAWDQAGCLCAPDFAGQFDKALQNVLSVVRAAGGTAADVLSLRLYVTDRQLYLEQRREVGAAYRRLFGRYYPAMALVQVAALLEPGALVEIEALAAVPAHDSPAPGGPAR